MTLVQKENADSLEQIISGHFTRLPRRIWVAVWKWEESIIVVWVVTVVGAVFVALAAVLAVESKFFASASLTFSFSFSVLFWLSFLTTIALLIGRGINYDRGNPTNLTVTQALFGQRFPVPFFLIINCSKGLITYSTTQRRSKSDLPATESGRPDR